MKRQPAARRYKLLRNIVLIVLGLIIFWFLLGTPALTKTQAFRRAMREHFLQPQEPEVYFGKDGRISALAKVGDIYFQTGLERDRLKWDHALWSETEAVDGVYIGPLVAYGRLADSPEVAVLAEGEKAELTFIDLERSYPLNCIGKQDGWFLFQFKRDKDYSAGNGVIDSYGYMYLGTPIGEKGCSFLFVSYDAEGRELTRVEKTY